MTSEMYRKLTSHMQLWRELAEAEEAGAIAKGLPRQRFRSSFLYTNIDQERYGVDLVVQNCYRLANLGLL